MKKIFQLLCQVSNLLTNIMNFFAPFFALGLRIWIASIYFWSGWLKINSWGSTLTLFAYEYKVPVISPQFAAYLGTGSELIFSLLLLLGLGARLPAIALFCTNVVMVISYPILLTPEGACMVQEHYLWGLTFATLAFYGHGWISLDHLVQKKICKEYRY